MPRYTQGMMDIGATVCLPRQPLCPVCPLADMCQARLRGNPRAYPVSTRKLKRTAQSVWLLWARSRNGAVWLQKRPAPGVWAGLYCMPWFESREDLEKSVPARYHAALRDLPTIKHVLTHKDLHLHPVRLVLPSGARAGTQGQWFGAHEWPKLGLPAPVRVLLLQA